LTRHVKKKVAKTFFSLYFFFFLWNAIRQDGGPSAALPRLVIRTGREEFVCLTVCLVNCEQQ
jgi:hypothetical protein